MVYKKLAWCTMKLNDVHQTPKVPKCSFVKIGVVMSKYSPLFLRKVKSGKWQGVLKYKDVNGKWKQLTKVSNQKLKRDARIELAAWETEMHKTEEATGLIGADTKKNEITLEEVVRDFLAKQYETGELELSTYNRQIHSAETRIFPYIGAYGFDGIDRNVISKWLTQLAKDGLKQGTIQSLFTIPNKVYNYYEKIGEISHNPFKYVQTPKKDKPKVTHLEPEQVAALEEALNKERKKGDWVWTGIYIALYSGLRRGEICGLRWHDIDFKRGTITVSTAIGCANSGAYAKNPKNDSSRRTFPMIEQLVKILEIRKQYVLDTYHTIDSSWFVIGDTVKYIDPRNLTKRFGEIVRKYDLCDVYGQHINIHALRHNIATLGVKSNMDIASLSAMLGHASRAMTLDTYADASPDAMKVASQKLSIGFEEEVNSIQEKEEK